MQNRTFRAEGIVLKRYNYAEADRVVTIFTKQYGKIVALAKGSRKITSRRAGTLEPATQAIFFFAHTKTFSIITQTQLINSFTKARSNFQRLIQIHQILEVVDLLTRENQAHPYIYKILSNTLHQLSLKGTKRNIIVQNVNSILIDLGFGPPRKNTESSLKAHLEEIIERPLRSKPMLTKDLVQ